MAQSSAKVLHRSLILASLFVLSLHCGFAQEAQVRDKGFGPLGGKVDARLIPTLKAFQNQQTTDQQGVAAVKKMHPRAIASAPADRLIVRLDVPALDAAKLARIAATGATVLHSAPQWNDVTLAATLAQVDALSRLAEVRRLALVSRPVRRMAGLVPNRPTAV
jgi:hypothetical protein